MNIEKYIQQTKKFQNLLLDFIENENSDCKDLINYYEANKYRENKEELKLILHLITSISENHYRCNGFYDKIHRFLLMIKDDIKNNISNIEIFNIFINNSVTLLFLIQNDILLIDSYLSKIIIQNESLYPIFYPEIKPFFDEKTQKEIMDEILQIDPNIFENYEKKRQEGDNDSYICQLIRNDSIEEFISYCNKTSISHLSLIPHSIFETHPFLIEKVPNLIEYAVFFGSIQIIKYFMNNNVELQPSLWIYVIHSNNAELLNLFEENHVELEDKMCKQIFSESIKCHHNAFADYIANIYLKDKNVNNDFSCFQYYNFEYFPSDFNEESILRNLCKYDYFELVKLTFADERINFKELINTIYIIDEIFIY